MAGRGPLSRKPIVLVGLPGAGKSTVARLVGVALGAPVVDVDEHIAAAAGKSIEAIFADLGEEAFRRLEQTLGEAALRGPPAVVATGGGYMEAPERRAAVLALGLVIYLATSPAEAARRLPGPTGRPLLDGAEPEARLRALLELRESGYLQAHHIVMTDKAAPAAVADAVVKLARQGGGW